MFFLNWKILSSFPPCSPCTDSSDCACIAGLLPSSDGCGRNNDPTDGFIRGWLRQPAGGWFGVKLKPKCQEQRVKRRVTGSKVTPTLSLCLSSVVDLRGRIFPPLWTRCLVCVCVCVLFSVTPTHMCAPAYVTRSFIALCFYISVHMPGRDTCASLLTCKWDAAGFVSYLCVKMSSVSFSAVLHSFTRGTGVLCVCSPRCQRRFFKTLVSVLECVSCCVCVLCWSISIQYGPHQIIQRPHYSLCSTRALQHLLALAAQ